LRVFCSLEKIPFGMGMDGTSSATAASSTLQTIEELVTSLKVEVEVELVPGGFSGTLEIEEQGVESCELSKRGVKRKNINIRINKLIVIRESTNKPNEMNRAFLSALSSWTLS
jgi:hypothetical protein